MLSVPLNRYIFNVWKCSLNSYVCDLCHSYWFQFERGNSTLGWTIVSSSFCRMLSSMKMCWMCSSKGSTHSGFPPRMEKVLLAHLDRETGKQKDMEKVWWGVKCHKTYIKCWLEECSYQSKWSWKPPRPCTELKYWYRPLSPSRVDTRSSARLRTIPLLLQRILPGVIFTLNWARRERERKSVNSSEFCCLA